MIECISAINNPRIKEVRSLKDKKNRYALSKFVVEGVNIVKDIPDFIDFDLYYTSGREDEARELMSRARVSIEVTPKVMQAMSDTMTPCGILAVADIPKTTFKGSDKVLYLDGITDPGNMGTIIRTAVALGIEDIIAVEAVDIYSNKVVRSSMGGIFNTNIVQCSENEAMELIKDYKVYSLDMHGDNIYDKSFTMDNTRFVLAVGSEAHGISNQLASRADRVLSLPMTDKIESLNAGVSMAAALYRIMYL